MQWIDCEFTAVGPAIFNLAFGVACCGDDKAKKELFIRSYMQALGEDPEEWEQLLLDAHLGRLLLWHSAKAES